MKTLSILIPFLFLLISCGLGIGGGSGDGNPSIVAHAIIEPGESCPTGGLQIDSGFDGNDNQVLDAEEITSSEMICNGDDGKNGVNASFNIVQLNPGDECSKGGYRIDSGQDNNKNEILDNNEVINSFVICQGKDGDVGSVGDDGNNGLNSLIALNPETPGSNCEFGGSLISVGFDSNDNKILEQDEISNETFLCEESVEKFDGLIFVADKTIDGVKELLRVDSDGGRLTRIDIPRSASGWIDASAAISPNQQYVAYQIQENQAQPMEIYVASLTENSREWKITTGLKDTGAYGTKFQWSPDSQRIAYLADKIENAAWGPTQLYSVLSDGGANKRISPLSIETNQGQVKKFEWSPNGNHLAYIANMTQAGSRELRSLSLDGSNDKNISGTMVVDGKVLNWLEWSPDSSKLAFIADKVTDKQFELFVTPFDGSTDPIKVSGDLGQLGGVVYNDPLLIWSNAWSPRGDQIAFMARTDSPPIYELYVAQADGGSVIPVSGTIGDIGSVYDMFLWSSDGHKLAFFAGPALDHAKDLYVVKKEGTDRVKVSNATSDSMSIRKVEWTPDTTALVYLADHTSIDTFELYFAYADAVTEPQKISGTLVSSGNVLDFTLSPDGTKVAYVADKVQDTNMELFVVDIDGQNTIKVSGSIVENGDVFAFENYIKWSGKSYKYYTID